MSAAEKHFQVPEIAELWGLSPDTVRKMFKDEPGVLKFGSSETRNKRGYVSLRIPESVVARVYARRCKKLEAA